MSFAICRIQKIGGAKDIAGIEIHNQRKREHSNSNPDIDHSRSKLNIQLASPNGSYSATVDGIIKKYYKGKRAVRKDAVRLCEVIFTSDKDFFSKSEDGGKAYLTACYEWAVNHFGENNVVAATIHMDEETPHMHFDFVPMTEDGRLSAKAVMGGRADLQRLQDDFYEQIGKRFGMDRGERADIENGEKGRAHYDTADYKLQMSRNDVDGLTSRIDTCLEEISHEDIDAKKKTIFHDATPQKVVLLAKDYARIRKVLRESKVTITTLTEMAIEKEKQISPTAVSRAFITKSIREKVKKNIKAVEAERKSHTKAKVKDKGIE